MVDTERLREIAENKRKQAVTTWKVKKTLLELEWEEAQILRAQSTIKNIPEIAEGKAREGEFRASIMELDPRDLKVYNPDRPKRLLEDEVKGAANTVFSWCKNNNLKPEIKLELSSQAYDDYIETYQIFISWEKV